MKKLLIATGNRGKLFEIRALFEELGFLAAQQVELLIPSMLGLQLEVEESGVTYDENATLKALAFARASQLLTLADDSGLEVDVLGGLPGIRSARFSPKTGATDADRRQYLLERLQAFPRPWLAHFHCTVALAWPSGEVRFAQGDCPGEVIPEERGTNGFGYDPIFLLHELGLTMAELSMAQKNQLSHRARAVRAALPILLESL